MRVVMLLRKFKGVSGEVYVTGEVEPSVVGDLAEEGKLIDVIVLGSPCNRDSLLLQADA